LSTFRVASKTFKQQHADFWKRAERIRIEIGQIHSAVGGFTRREVHDELVPVYEELVKYSTKVDMLLNECDVVRKTDEGETHEYDESDVNDDMIENALYVFDLVFEGWMREPKWVRTTVSTGFGNRLY
jgi:hypothetical protein